MERADYSHVAPELKGLYESVSALELELERKSKMDAEEMEKTKAKIDGIRSCLSFKNGEHHLRVARALLGVG